MLVMDNTTHTLFKTQLPAPCPLEVRRFVRLDAIQYFNIIQFKDTVVASILHYLIKFTKWAVTASRLMNLHLLDVLFTFIFILWASLRCWINIFELDAFKLLWEVKYVSNIFFSFLTLRTNELLERRDIWKIKNFKIKKRHNIAIELKQVSIVYQSYSNWCKYFCDPTLCSTIPYVFRAMQIIFHYNTLLRYNTDCYINDNYKM